MAVADSLLQTSEYSKAALEYQLVAELYPHTTAHAPAARNAAFLNLYPDNPTANESTATFWLGEYIQVAPPSEARRAAEVAVRLLNRIDRLKQERDRLQARGDSLTAVLKKQGEDLSGRHRHVQNLEAELRKVQKELRELREIDVRISKGREKK